MDYKLFKYCKENGIPEYYAVQYENQLRFSFRFIAWSVVDSAKDFLTWFVHGKRGW